jgi:cell division protein FtsA
MNENYVVGIDIGSSNLRVLTAELGEDDRIKIIGVSSRPLEGMHKGEVRDSSAVNESLREAVSRAEKMAGVKIRGACVSITGSEVRSFESEGVLTRQEDEPISEEEADYVTENARKVPLPADRTVIHMLEQAFMIDGESRTGDPVGMRGSRLERCVHIVTAVRRQVETLRDLLKWNGIEPVRIVFAPLADGRLISGPGESGLNGLVVNIGGEVTSFARYSGGFIRSSGVLPVGGFNISNDLSIGMSLPLNVTEELKTRICLFDSEYGGKEGGESIEIEIDGRDYSFRTEETSGIAAPRCEELFSLIGSHAGVGEMFGGPVFLSGAGSRLMNIDKVAEAVFKVPAVTVDPSGVEGLVELAGDSGWITCTGLLFHGRDLISGYREGRENGYFTRIMNGLKKVVC